MLRSSPSWRTSSNSGSGFQMPGVSAFCGTGAHDAPLSTKYPHETWRLCNRNVRSVHAKWIAGRPVRTAESIWGILYLATLSFLQLDGAIDVHRADHSDTWNSCSGRLQVESGWNM